MNTFVIQISHIDFVILVNPYAGRHPEFAVFLAWSAKIHQQSAYFIKDLDIVKKGVNHINIAVTVAGDTPGPGKITGTVPGAALSKLMVCAQQAHTAHSATIRTAIDLILSLLI